MQNTKQNLFRKINLVMEYGETLNGCKYAIASALSEKELREKYAEELAAYEPFIYLTEEMGDAIVSSQRNNSKFKKRCNRSEIPAGYSEGDTERYMNDLYTILGGVDPCEIVAAVEEEEQRTLRRQRELELLADAWNELSAKQQKRLHMYFWKKMTFREIAAAENTHHSSIEESITASVKKLKKFFEKHPAKTPSSSQ